MIRTHTNAFVASGLSQEPVISYSVQFLSQNLGFKHRLHDMFLCVLRKFELIGRWTCVINIQQREAEKDLVNVSISASLLPHVLRVDVYEL